jgi:hypothetical protein
VLSSRSSTGCYPSVRASAAYTGLAGSTGVESWSSPLQHGRAQRTPNGQFGIGSSFFATPRKKLATHATELNRTNYLDLAPVLPIQPSARRMRMTSGPTAEYRFDTMLWRGPRVPAMEHARGL